MRFGWLFYWLTVLILAVGVPVALYRYGTRFDSAHPADTTGGPLTIAICVVLGVVFDLLLLLCAVVVWSLLLVRRSRQLVAAEADVDLPRRSQVP